MSKGILINEKHAKEIKKIKDQEILVRIEKEQSELFAIIPGLDLVRKAAYEDQKYFDAFEKCMADESNDGAKMPLKPKKSLDELLKEYPLAAAYFRAENYFSSANFEKSKAGKKAMESLRQNQDIGLAKSIMDNWLDIDKALYD